MQGARVHDADSDDGRRSGLFLYGGDPHSPVAEPAEYGLPPPSVEAARTRSCGIIRC